MNKSEYRIVFSPYDGGFYAQRYSDWAVTKKVYGSPSEIQEAVQTDSVEWVASGE